MSEGERRLAAIMFTDIVGYTSLTQKDEALSMQLLEEHRKLVRPFFPKHNGREVKTIGDAFLVEFSSALEAVRCAFDIQQSMHEINSGRLPEKQVLLRIGVHVGDVIHSQNDIYGDAVNVANRIESLAMPGGICVSDQVYDHVRNKFEFPLVSIGKKELKNVGEPMEVYKVVMPWEQAAAVEAPKFATNRIAILPFTSFSLDPNDAFFADGMTEEIISTVSGISGLKVISRTSVMGYKGTTKKVEEIGRELKVGSVLEGSFRKAGNRIRVTTQLISVADDEHLWAQNYDRNLDDVFEVQSDVAKQVAEALKVRILSPERERIEKKPTESTLAYTLYLKGRHLWNLRLSGSARESIGNLKSALNCFEQAVAEDPNFALGYVGQAECCLLLRNNHRLELEANLKRAKETVGRALELDPELAEAHTTLGMVHADEYDPRRAEEEYRKAIELKPSYAVAHYWYFHLLRYELRWEEALEQIEKALELDPLSPAFNSNLAAFYYDRRDYGKALELCSRAIELGVPNTMKGHIYGKTKMFAEMRREWERWTELEQTSLPWARTAADFWMAFYENDTQTCRKLVPELVAHFGKEMGLSAYGVSEVYFSLGENEKGFEWLERSYATKEPGLPYMKCDELLEGVRTDPRYLDLLKRLGLEETLKRD